MFAALLTSGALTLHGFFEDRHRVARNFSAWVKHRYPSRKVRKYQDSVTVYGAVDQDVLRMMRFYEAIRAGRTVVAIICPLCADAEVLMAVPEDEGDPPEVCEAECRCNIEVFLATAEPDERSDVYDSFGRAVYAERNRYNPR